jgi:hypothetical protein
MEAFVWITFQPFALKYRAYNNNIDISMNLFFTIVYTYFLSILPDNKVGKIPIRYLTMNATVNVLINPRLQF